VAAHTHSLDKHCCPKELKLPLWLASSTNIVFLKSSAKETFIKLVLLS
jgi:hypothetical protein